MTDTLLTERPDLSTSKVAEWRLWTYVVAVVIHAFELILDLFRAEIETAVDKVVSGTERWYAEMCYRFQNGHTVLFDDKTATWYYAEDDPDARIVKVAAISVKNKKLFIKVAKFDAQGKVGPLSAEELFNFSGYISAIKFSNDEADTISTDADMIRYNLEVFYNPAVPVTVVRQGVEQVLADFRMELSFDAKFYTQRLIDKVMRVDGVVTVDPKSFARKGADTAGEFVPVSVMTELQSGYFDFDTDSVLGLTSIKANG